MSDRLDRYFALEATDYLEQLEELLEGGGRPDLDQLLRLCRGVRGSAQMAGAESVAAVAERLEEGIRSVQGNHVAWSEGIRQLSRQTVADLKLLVRASGHWGEMDDTKVRQALERWNEVEPEAGAAEDGELRMTWQDALPDPRPRERTQGVETEVAIEVLFYDDAGPHVLTSEGEDTMNQPMISGVGQPVPIETLLLDPESAVREALGMRDRIERAMREVPGAELDLAPVLRELFELLEIAAGGVAAPG